MKRFAAPLFVVAWVAMVILFISLHRRAPGSGAQPLPHLTASPASLP